METENKKRKYLIVSGVIAIIFFGSVVVFNLLNNDQVNYDEFDPKKKLSPDIVEVQQISEDRQLISNKTRGYEFTVPSGWYLQEPQGGDFWISLNPQGENQCSEIDLLQIDNPKGISPEDMFKYTSVRTGDVAYDEYISMNAEKFGLQLKNDSVIIKTETQFSSTIEFHELTEGIITVFRVISYSPHLPEECEKVFIESINTFQRSPNL